MSETSTTKAEELDWERQLSDAVDSKADELVRSGAKPASRWESAFTLKAPDGTSIRLAKFTTMDHPSAYVPARVTLHNFDGVFTKPVPGTQVNVDESTIYSQHRDDVPLEFMVDTHPSISGFPPRAVYAVDASGDTSSTDIEKGAHYEAFAEPDGTHVYKLGEDQQLHAVDAIEGGHLLWQVASSAPSETLGA